MSKGLDCARHPLPIIGMSLLEHKLPGRRDFPGLQAEQPVEVVRPHQLVCLRAPMPASDLGRPFRALHQGQAMLGRRRVGPLLGHVGEPNRGSGRITRP